MKRNHPPSTEKHMDEAQRFVAGRKRLKLKPEEIELRILIPSTYAGVIIGKAGSNIAKFRTEHSCKAIVFDSPGPERILDIIGTLENVVEFVYGVTQLPSLQADGSPLKPRGAKEDTSGWVDVRILVHMSQSGGIIGKGGTRVNELRDTFKVRIKCYADNCPDSTDRVVQLVGNPEKVKECMKKILELCRDVCPAVGPSTYYDPRRFDEYSADIYGGYAGNGIYLGGRGGGGGFGDRDNGRNRRGGAAGRGGGPMGGGRRGPPPALDYGADDDYYGGGEGYGYEDYDDYGPPRGRGPPPTRMGPPAGRGMPARRGGPPPPLEDWYEGGGRAGPRRPPPLDDFSGPPRRRLGPPPLDDYGPPMARGSRMAPPEDYSFGGGRRGPPPDDEWYGDVAPARRGPPPRDLMGPPERRRGPPGRMGSGEDDYGGGFGGGPRRGPMEKQKFWEDFSGQDYDGNGADNGYGVEPKGPVKTTKVVVQKEHVGAIFGMKGRNMEMVRSESGAKIVAEDGPPSKPDSKVLSITGTTEQINHASFLLQESVRRHGKPKPGGTGMGPAADADNYY